METECLKRFTVLLESFYFSSEKSAKWKNGPWALGVVPMRIIFGHTVRDSKKKLIRKSGFLLRKSDYCFIIKILSGQTTDDKHTLGEWGNKNNNQSQNSKVTDRRTFYVVVWIVLTYCPFRTFFWSLKNSGNTGLLIRKPLFFILTRFITIS